MFPKYRDIEYPLLRELARRGGSAAPQDTDERGRSVYAALADEFGLSAAEREERTEDGEGRVHWEKMVRWARQKLLDRGLLGSSQRGTWEVTRDGIEFLQAEVEAVGENAVAGQSFLPEEVAEPSRFIEGASRRVSVNAYERNSNARCLCIKAYGTSCCICGFSFGAMYGTEAEGYIHVHHLRPLSAVGGEYVLDPVDDLRPVCPNCHAVLHLGGRCRSIEEVVQLLWQQSHAEPGAAPDRGGM